MFYGNMGPRGFWNFVQVNGLPVVNNAGRRASHPRQKSHAREEYIPPLEGFLEIEEQIEIPIKHSR